MWRLLAKEVLIMAIEVDSGAEVVDGADSEDEDSVEMVSQVVDGEVIAGEAIRRQPYNKLRIGDNLELQDKKRAFFVLYQKSTLRTNFLSASGQKQSFEHHLFAEGAGSSKIRRCVCYFPFYFTLVSPGSRTR